MDESILDRVDRVAELRREGRSEVLERMVRNGIESEEELLDVMGRPVVGAVVKELMKMPGFWETIGKAVGDNVPPEKWKQLAEKADLLREAGQRRRAEKKGK